MQSSSPGGFSWPRSENKTGILALGVQVTVRGAVRFSIDWKDDLFVWWGGSISVTRVLALSSSVPMCSRTPAAGIALPRWLPSSTIQHCPRPTNIPPGSLCGFFQPPWQTRVLCIYPSSSLDGGCRWGLNSTSKVPPDQQLEGTSLSAEPGATLQHRVWDSRALSLVPSLNELYNFAHFKNGFKKSRNID